MYQACIVFHWKACFCRSQAICATLVWMFFSSSQCFWRAGSLPVAASLIPQTGILLPLCSPSACITTSLCLKLFFFGFDSAVLLTLVIYWYLTFLGVISLWDMDISYLKSLFFFFFLLFVVLVKAMLLIPSTREIKKHLTILQMAEQRTVKAQKLWSGTS